MQFFSATIIFQVEAVLRIAVYSKQVYVNVHITCTSKCYVACMTTAAYARLNHEPLLIIIFHVIARQFSKKTTRKNPAYLSRSRSSQMCGKQSLLAKVAIRQN